MTIYQFINEATKMRNGSPAPRVGCPRSYSYLKAKRVAHEKLDAAYGALHRFRIKHPDSTRTRRARARHLDRWEARAIENLAPLTVDLPTVWTPKPVYDWSF